MITINCYNFSKKENSTARPSGSGKAYSCAVKTGSSIISPVIEISETSLPSYNYAYISNFKRYYFITNIVYDRGIWVLSLTVDVMATYRPGIGGTSGYITRSSRRSQSSIIDTLYPVTGDSEIVVRTIENGDSISWEDGTIVVSVLNGHGTTGTTAYVFEPSEFKKFINGLMGPLADTSKSIWDNVEQSIKVTTYEPLRYVNGAWWFPHGFDTSIPVIALQLGNYRAEGFSCAPLMNHASPYHKSYNVNVPKHPQAAERGSYMNLSPFTEYELQIAPFGTLKLDTTALMDSNTINIDILPDPYTGLARMIATASNGFTLADIATQWGVPIKISSYGNLSTGNILQTAAGVGGAIIGGIAGDMQALTGGIASSFKGVSDIARGSFDTVGSTGAIIDHQTDKKLYSRFFYASPEDNGNNGRPYCYNNTPANLGGYMQMQKGLFTSDTATQTEINSVNAFMEGGFYYE